MVITALAYPLEVQSFEIKELQEEQTKGQPEPQIWVGPGPKEYTLNRGHTITVPKFVRLISRKKYTGPVEVTMVFRSAAEPTFFVARGDVGFGWMKDHRIICPPDPMTTGRPDLHPIEEAYKPGTWYTIRWRMTEDQISILEPGKIPSFRRKLDLSRPAIFGIAANETPLEVRSFEVKPYKP
jgi:hypothetical protein